MQEIRIDYKSIGDLRSRVPKPVDDNIEILIEHANFLELLRGYERYIEYTNALKQLEKVFQDKINRMINHRHKFGDYKSHINVSVAEANLRRHRDFIIAVLGD